MKRKIFAYLTVLALLSLIFSISASAYTDKDKNFSIKAPDSFTEINSANVKEHQDFLQKINYTASGFKDYLTKNNIVFYAINKQNGSEIVLKSVSSEFSKNIDDLYMLDNAALAHVAEKLFESNDYTVLEKNGTKFLKVSISSKDNGGNFFGSQFITVKNGLVYSLSLTFGENINTMTSIEIQERVLNDFYINEKSGFSWGNFGNIIITVIVTACILLFVAVAGYVVYTFINDARNKNSSNDVAPYVKIKRRKF